MKKFKYLKISKTKKLRFIDNYYKKNLYIVFLPGFMSDIDGEKPQAFKKYAVKNKLGFLAIEYSGHGKSSGKFTKGNITKWSYEAKNSINRIVKNRASTYYPPRSQKVLNLISRFGTKNSNKCTLGGCIFERRKNLLHVTREF